MTSRWIAALAAAIWAGLIPLVAAAQDAAYVWRNVKVGGGGFIPGVVFSPVEPGLAYARSDMGGAYRFDRAAGRWIPLQDGEPESSYYGVESIAPDPNDAEVVYAAVGMGRQGPAAILRSSNRGETWEQHSAPFQMGGNEDGRGLGERLAVDPGDSAIIYFGSRHDGLQQSRDAGRTWRPVSSFPHRGRGVPNEGTNPGLSFVVIDPASGAPGRASQRIYVGVADPGAEALYWSDDAGRAWRRIEGGPGPGFAPAQAEIDARGMLYVTFSRGVGPNGVTDGGLWRLNTHSGGWTDITPPKPGQGGFMALSLDRQRPGVLVVATMNRWHLGDTLWRSTDDGVRWVSLREQAVRDVSATPFLNWGRGEPDFGWWIAALAIDPFDSDHIVYGTGATLYASRDLSQADAGRPTHWRPWVEGIEQTAVITLTSPRTGPHLLTGLGDISGFAHEDLSTSPARQFTNPVFGNTNSIAYAWHAPNIVVRAGTPHEGVGSDGADGSTLAWSDDAGLTWRPLGRPTPSNAQHEDTPLELYRDAPIIVSADGETFVVGTPTPILSRDRGASWRTVVGLSEGLQPIADRDDPLIFYALNYSTGEWYASVDGALSFSRVPSRGLPGELWRDQPYWREVPSPILATPGRAGDVWFISSRGLYRSRDGGQNFRRVETGGVLVQRMDFGAPVDGGAYPTLYAIAERAGARGIYRSTDEGRSWVRVNDDAHQYARRYRAIAGDPRIPGRVYLATDGRGVVYGEPRP